MLSNLRFFGGKVVKTRLEKLHLFRLIFSFFISFGYLCDQFLWRPLLRSELRINKLTFYFYLKSANPRLPAVPIFCDLYRRYLWLKYFLHYNWKISQPIESYTFIIIVLIFFLVVICAPLMSIAIDATLDVTLNGEFRLFLH